MRTLTNDHQLFCIQDEFALIGLTDAGDELWATIDDADPELAHVSRLKHTWLFNELACQYHRSLAVLQLDEQPEVREEVADRLLQSVMGDSAADGPPQPATGAPQLAERTGTLLWSLRAMQEQVGPAADPSMTGVCGQSKQVRQCS